MVRNCTPESPLFQLMDFDKPTILIDDKGEFYNGKRGLEYFDALVYFPRTNYIYNRPNWLINSNENEIYKVEDISIDFPVIIQAFNKNESNKAVPIDIIELEYKYDRTVLVLPKGEYRLEIVNRVGDTEERLIDIQ